MLPILTTKFHIPPTHPDQVLRPLLVSKLQDGLWHTKGVNFLRRLTVVAAPAGYGKSTLLCEWVGHLDIPVAWITFDEVENDPVRFLQYLIVALQTICPGVGETVLAVSQSPQYTSTQLNLLHAVTALVQEIAVITPPFILIFDDYHTLKNPIIHESVMWLLDHMPENLSLVIATRADPPLPLSRMRARRHLLEVRADALRFSGVEATDFFRLGMHIDLKDAEITCLVERTEGWIAGLQMAALVLQSCDDIAKFIRDFSGRERFVIDYLFEEVFNRQSQEIQSFLIQTSILDHMTGPLCDAVLGKLDALSTGLSPTAPQGAESGQQILESLDRSNLFVVPLDNERHYYRYHHLFADLLRHRLHRNSPGLIPTLHILTAEWFEKEGRITDALEHRISAHDFNNASRLMEENGYNFINQGNFQWVLNWLQQFPQDLVLSRPWLCILYSWGLIFNGKIEEGDGYLSAAEKILSSTDETTDPAVREKLGHIAGVRTYLAALHQDVAGMTRYAQEALNNLDPNELLMRSFVELLLGSGWLFRDDLVRADEAYSKAASLGKSAGSLFVVVSATCMLASLARIRGELHRAENLLEEVKTLVIDDKGRLLPVASEIFLEMFNLHFQWNDLKSAEQDVIAAKEIAQLYSIADTIVECMICQALIRLAQGNLKAAEECFQIIDQENRQFSRSLKMAIMAHRMMLYLAKGDLLAVSRIVEQYEWNIENQPIFRWDAAFIVYTKYLVTQDKDDEAFRLLEQYLARLEACGLWMFVCKVLIVQAVILHSQGKLSLAQHKMERALSLAEPGGYIRMFINEGEPVKSLISRYRTQPHIEPRLKAYADRLLAEFPTTQPDTSTEPSIKRDVHQDLADPLTFRELEVLQHIAAGLSNKEIAEKLVLSIGTVKAHTSSIYRKLDVLSRTKAIAKAQEIHMI